jgi:hypothetical protein
MKFIKEQHLRVKTPITTDGLTLAYDSFQRPKYSITHLPITAKAALEKANKRLPNHLKKIIEIIDPIEAPKSPAANLKKLVGELEVAGGGDNDDTDEDDEPSDEGGPVTKPKPPKK